MKKIYALFLLAMLATGFSAKAYNPHVRAKSILPGLSTSYMRFAHPVSGLTGNILSWGINGDCAWELQIPKFSHIVHLQAEANYYLMPGTCGQINMEGVNRKGWGAGLTAGFFHETGVGLNVSGQAAFLNGMKTYGFKAGPSFINIFNLYAGYMQTHLQGEGVTTRTGHFQFGIELNINLATGITVLD
jgi:hypothetical protein